jgi:hypothetical protein
MEEEKEKEEAGKDRPNQKARWRGMRHGGGCQHTKGFAEPRTDENRKEGTGTGKGESVIFVMERFSLGD